MGAALPGSHAGCESGASGLQLGLLLGSWRPELGSLPEVQLTRPDSSGHIPRGTERGGGRVPRPLLWGFNPRPRPSLTWAQVSFPKCHPAGQDLLSP